MKPLISIIDHLVYVTPDLETSVIEIERLLGVQAAIGGQHPGWGTRNALLSLGPKVYLEIMGADRSQPQPNQPRPFGIDALLTPRLATWVVRSDNIQAITAKAEREGIDLGELQNKSRKRPDGSILKWAMTDLRKNREDGILPYFIDWGDSPHPAEDSPKGCRLVKLEAFHPEAPRINGLLERLGIDLHVQSGSVSLKATIQTPRGETILG